MIVSHVLGVDTSRHFEDLTDQDALDEGFQNKQELVEDLKRYYRRLDAHQPITVIYFEPLGV